MKVLTEIAPVGLPAGWPMRRVRDVATLTNGFPFKSEDFDSSGEVPLVRIRDLTACEFELYVPRCVVPHEAFMRNGDLAIGMDGDFNSVLWNRGSAALNQRVCILRPRGGTDIRFLAYVLPSALQIINDLTYSTTVKHLSGSDVLHQLIPFPDIKQQQRISQYLDRETTQIDEMIGKQERLIALIAEKRQAVITHAVTKGLDPTVPTKPSGVPWLGDIPAHWTVTKVKHYFSATLGKMLQSANQPPEGSVVIPYLRAGNIQPDGIDVNEVKKMPFTPAEATALDLRAGDLVVVEGGAGFGRSDVLKSDLIGWGFQNHVIRVRPHSNLSTDFLDLVLKMSLSNGLIANLSNHATIPSLSSDKLLNLEFSAPPSDEAARICRHVDSRLTTLKNLTDSAESVICLLKERRSALIAAAVTGKIAMEDEPNV